MNHNIAPETHLYKYMCIKNMTPNIRLLLLKYYYKKTVIPSILYNY